MNTNEIKVSIVVPCYNVSKYIKECINSIIGQTLQEIEIICVNDGSTDNTLDILKEYEKIDKRIKIINKKNSGYGHSMNVGFDNAHGKYIGIVESDDFILPTMFEMLYNIAESKNYDIVKSDFYTFTGDISNRNYFYNNTCTSNTYYGKSLNADIEPEIFRFAMNTWTGIYNKEFLNNNNIRHHESPGASYQDNGFWFQTFCYAKSIYFYNKAFYVYRIDNIFSSINNPNKALCAFDEYEWIRDILEKNGIFEKFKSQWHYKKLHNIMFTMQRVSENSRPVVLERAKKEYSAYITNKEIKKDFFNEDEWNYITSIIENSIFKHKHHKKIKIYNDGIYRVIKIFGIKIKYIRKKLLKEHYMNEINNLRININVINQMQYYTNKQEML